MVSYWVQQAWDVGTTLDQVIKSTLFQCHVPTVLLYTKLNCTMPGATGIISSGMGTNISLIPLLKSNQHQYSKGPYQYQLLEVLLQYKHQPSVFVRCLPTSNQYQFLQGYTKVNILEAP